MTDFNSSTSERSSARSESGDSVCASFFAVRRAMRATGSPSTWSQHAYGRAIDVNPLDGNQILAGFVLGFDPSGSFRHSSHTLENIRTALEKSFAYEHGRDRYQRHQHRRY